MGGFASFIGGLGPELNTYNRQGIQNRHELQKQSNEHLHEDYGNMLKVIEANANRYPKDVADGLYDVLAQASAGHPTSREELNRTWQAYNKAKQDANKQWATHPDNPINKIKATQAVVDAHSQATGGQAAPQPQSMVPPITAPTPAQSPFQSAISGPDTGFTGASRMPSLAQAPTSPVQGGGSSSPATFRTPPPAPNNPAVVQPVAASLPGPADIANGPEPGAQQAPNPAIPPAIEEPPPDFKLSASGSTVAPVVNLDDLLARSIYGMHQTGMADDLLTHAITGQMGTEQSLGLKQRENELAMGLGRQKIEALRAIPGWSDLPPIVRSELEAQAVMQQSVPNFSNLLIPKSQPGWITPDQLPAGATDIEGNPVTPGDAKFFKKFVMGGALHYQPDIGPGTQGVVMPDKNSPTGYSRIVFSREGQEIGRTLGAQPPASAIGTSTDVTSPGAATVHTEVKKVVPGAGGTAAPAIAPVPGAPPPPVRLPAGGGAKPAAGTAPSGTNSAVALRAQKVASGEWGIKDVGDARAQAETIDYMAKHKMDIPVQLSSAGQVNLQKVDAVLGEIDDLDKQLGGIKDTQVLAPYYLAYKAGIYTPYNDLFTKLSFEGLRSAAAALQGNGSKAYPVIQKAFVHVPNLDRLGGFSPDSIKEIKSKLKAMREVLGKTRVSVLNDERKSGVPGGIQGVPGGATGGPAPTTAEEFWKSIQP